MADFKLLISPQRRIVTEGIWNYDGLIGGAVPVGTYQTDSGFPNLISIIYISEIDLGGTDQTIFLDSLEIGDIIYLRNLVTGGVGGTSSYKIIALSHPAGYYNFSVQYTVSGFQLVENDDYRILINKKEFFGEADLYPNEGIQLNREILSETGVRNTIKQFTKDFTIPASPNNNFLLNHFELKSNESIPNPNLSIAAKIVVAGVYVIAGTLELLSVTWKMKKPEHYQLVFYGSESVLKSLIGETLLSEIDWSDFQFDWSIEAVKESWDKDSLTPTANGNVFIPIISWKRAYQWYPNEEPYADADLYANNIGYNTILTTTGVKLIELRVGLRLKDIIVAIGNHFNLTMVFYGKVSDFLTEAFVIPSKYEDQALSLSPGLFSTDVQTSDPIINTEVEQIVTLPLINSDPRGNWTEDYLYRAEFTGQYLLNFQLEGLNRKRVISIYEKGVNPPDPASDILVDDLIANGTLSNANIQVGLTEGTQYYFTVYINTGVTGAEDLNFRFITERVPISLIGQPYLAANNMPVMKVIDFVSKFLATFNLVIQQSDLREFTITDTASLYKSQETFNLEDYVDEKLLTYKKVSVFDFIQFKHKTNKDAANIYFFDTSGREYGELDFVADVDYSTGTLEKTSEFNIFPPEYMGRYDSLGLTGSTDLRHHAQLTNDEPPKPLLSNFLLMYRNSVYETEYSWNLQDGNAPTGEVTYQQQLTWGGYSQIQTDISTELSNTLCYSVENPFAGVPAKNTISRAFWIEWLLQLYKRTAYTLEISFPVNYGVYLKLNNISTIYLNGFYHVLASWTYETNTNLLTIKLLRTDYISQEEIDIGEENGRLTLIHD